MGIGTGLGQNPAENHLDWMRKGRWTRSGQRGAALPNATPAPQEWLRSTTQLPELIEALRESGYFNASELTAILGGNWMRVYEAVLTR